jgi:hypothetical protein
MNLGFEDPRAALACDAHCAPENGVDRLAGGALGGDQDLRERDRRGQRASGEASGVGEFDGLLGGGESIVGLVERELGLGSARRRQLDPGRTD